MGFRTNTFAMVWETKPTSDTLTRARISVSRKDKTSGEFVQDFTGFVSFVGTACAAKAAKLKAKDRIKLGEVDVTNRYDKEKNVTYTNYNVYSFEMANDKGTSAPAKNASRTPVDELSDNLPF